MKNFVCRVTFFLLTMFITGYCSTSKIYTIKFLTLNYEDEGYLNHDFLQSIGISALRNDGKDREEISKNCLRRAERIAKERLLHTILNTNPRISEKHRNEGKTAIFSKADIVFWSHFWEEILSQTKVVYQEIKDNTCKVVLRLEREGLLKEIRNYKL